MLLLALGCSFSTYDHVPCTASSECREEKFIGAHQGA